MGRGGYNGPTEPLGLAGCFVVIPFFLFAVGFIIEDLGYGGAPGWQVLLALLLASIVAFVLARGIAWMIGKIPAQGRGDGI